VVSCEIIAVDVEQPTLMWVIFNFIWKMIMKIDRVNEVYEKGKLYKFDGEQFVELPEAEDVFKLPVTKLMHQRIIQMRNEVHQALKKKYPNARRPEIDVVASVVLGLGIRSEIDLIATEVWDYYKAIYGQS